jgi:hypothetical protein
VGSIEYAFDAKSWPVEEPAMPMLNPIVCRPGRPINVRARAALPRSAVALAGVLIAGLLAGCGNDGIAGIDGVELNGGVFDALGLSEKGPKKEKVPQVAARPGLVLPPDDTRLPPPADKAQIAAATSTEAWPVGPEEQKARTAAALDKQQKDYCEKALQNARLNNENGPVMGPKGSCRGGLLSSGLFEWGGDKK